MSDYKNEDYYLCITISVKKYTKKMFNSFLSFSALYYQC